MAQQVYFGQQPQQPPPQQFQQHPPPQQFQQHPPPQQYQQFQQMGFCRPGLQAPTPSQHYGSYGNTFHQNVYNVNAWQAMNFQTEDEFSLVFNQHKSQRFNAIQAEELMRIMNENQQIRAYYKVNWSLELCKIMIAMLDRTKDGMMQYEEFRELLQCLVYWYQCFCAYDLDRSGFIEASELGRVITEKFGYTLSAKALECLLKRYSRAMDDGRLLIAFDDFVSLSVRLRAYTEAFRARDRQRNNGYETGSCEFGYDDFLQCTMCL